MIKERTSNFRQVKELASGRWGSIISSLYPDFAKATINPGPNTRIRCPLHHSSKEDADGFRFFKDFEQTGGGICNTCGAFATGLDLIAKIENNSLHTAMKILEDYFGINSTGVSTKARLLPSPRFSPKTEVPQEEIIKRKEILNTMWKSGIPFSALSSDNLAIRYLFEERGIRSMSLLHAQRSIRFQNNMMHVGKGGARKYFPGLVSIYHNHLGESKGLHRTYLDPNGNGKAKVDNAKKALKRLDESLSGAVALTGRHSFSSHINICEGIETGLSVVYATGQPVVAATTGTLMSGWAPFEGVKAVTIWADRDENSSGTLRADELRMRLAEMSIQCRILLPDPAMADDSTIDWNDVLRLRGADVLRDAYTTMCL